MTGGELCFNTGMTGYQEVMTDPSYAGQIVTFTFPHIGNTGANDADMESARVHARGLVLRADITAPASHRSEQSFDAWLRAQDITGISGVDTRRLTQHLREHGAQNAVIGYTPGALPDVARLHWLAGAQEDMRGRDIAVEVSTTMPYEWTQGRFDLNANRFTAPLADRHVVVVDYGVKRNILRALADQGLRLTVLPCTATAADILALKPDGVFLSNGPGDPAATGAYAVPVIREILRAQVPLFGICLGHQLLALALGGRTEKLRMGHRGLNHPVKNLQTGRVEITSQNHGFHVVPQSLPHTVKVTHVSLFDGTNEGIALKNGMAFSVQYHPEAAPGPQDSQYLFAQFRQLIDRCHQQPEKIAA